MLTCVVSNQGNYTVMWRRNARRSGAGAGAGGQEQEASRSSNILTANMLRVASDKRLRVMHEEGGQVSTPTPAPTSTTFTPTHISTTSTPVPTSTLVDRSTSS